MLDFPYSILRRPYERTVQQNTCTDEQQNILQQKENDNNGNTIIKLSSYVKCLLGYNTICIKNE